MCTIRLRYLPVSTGCVLVLCAPCLQPYDKFAGLYGAKTYWGYDGADTGEDPFEARMWDTRQPAHTRPPKQWDGYVPDHGGFDDRSASLPV
jgi:hypothetical protein